MPLPITFSLVIIGAIIKNKYWKKRLIYSGIGLLIFFSNPFLSNVAMKAWEGTPTSIHQLRPHDLGVILTGVTNRYKQPNDRVYMERGADRVLHTIQLYKSGLIKKILISGGSGKLIDNSTDVKEADELKKVLLLSGVSERDISIENESRNTYESARNVTRLLSDQSIILITSAFHIPRAKACFQKQNYKFTSFGTDYYSHDRSYNFDDFIIPKSTAIKNWEKIFKESLGMTMYWILGYI